MRKICSIIIAGLAILTLLAGCGSQSQSNSQAVASNSPAQSAVSSDAPAESVAESASSEYTPIVIGETIITETREITINHVELSYDVEPLDKGAFYTHYPADSGEVYIDIAFTVKNTQKQQLECTDVLSAMADYNDGYEYKGFAVVEDSTTGFTQAIISSIDPLESVGMRYLIKCPQEVEENTDAPLFVIITIEGTKYQYVIR